MVTSCELDLQPHQRQVHEYNAIAAAEKYNSISAEVKYNNISAAEKYNTLTAAEKYTINTSVSAVEMRDTERYSPHTAAEKYNSVEMRDTERYSPNTAAERYSPIPTAERYNINTISAIEKYNINPISAIEKYNINPISAIEKYNINPISAIEKYNINPISASEKYNISTIAAAEKYNINPISASEKYNISAIAAAEKYNINNITAAEKYNINTINAAEKYNINAITAAEKFNINPISAAEKYNISTIAAAEKYNINTITAAEKYNINTITAAEKYNINTITAAEKYNSITAAETAAKENAVLGMMILPECLLGSGGVTSDLRDWEGDLNKTREQTEDITSQSLTHLYHHYQNAQNKTRDQTEDITSQSLSHLYHHYQNAQSSLSRLEQSGGFQMKREHVMGYSSPPVSSSSGPADVDLRLAGHPGTNTLDDRLQDMRTGQPPPGTGGGGTGGLESLGQHHMAPASLYARANGASSASPPTVSTPSMLIVPQPINVAKMPPTPPGALGHLGQHPQNGTARKYQCKMCPQIFGSKADLQLHTQIHMREAKPYKCSQCSKAFANSSYLSQHTRIHLGIKPYRCEICQRKFTQLSHLQQHIRTHTGDKPYKCRHPGCNKAFSQLSNLQSHSRCHQTDKPYKCNSCYKCFSDEGSLLEHIPKHKESKHLKTHICQYCGKSYTQETYLQKHMQKHAERVDKRPPLGGVHSIGNPYWPKPEHNAFNAVDAMDTRMTELCQQDALLQRHHVVPSRHDLDPRIDDMRHTHTPAHMTTQNMYDSLGTKTSSAFTPIQTNMLPLTSSSQISNLSMGSSSQRYFPYDPINFPKTHTQMPSMDVKPNQFPNQLISLHQIRNYAGHQPNISSDLLQKDKGVTQ